MFLKLTIGNSCLKTTLSLKEVIPLSSSPRYRKDLKGSGGFIRIYKILDSTKNIRGGTKEVAFRSSSIIIVTVIVTMCQILG